MAFMLKVRWNIRPGQRAAFEAAQRELCAVMLDIPASSATTSTIRPRRRASGSRSTPTTPPSGPTSTTPRARPRSPPPTPPATSIDCRCFGDPDAASRAILKGFGTTFHPTAAQSFVLNPRADRDSEV